MWTDPQTLLRGLAKLVAVVVAAGLIGAGVGVGLAKLSGNDGGDAPVPAALSATSTTPAGSQVPRVDVLSAILGRRSRSTGRALVAAGVRIANDTGSPLDVEDPALLSGEDEVAVNASASGAPNPLLRTLDPGAGATGTLRFTLSPELARRLARNPAARLRVAGRVVALKLTKETP